MTQNVDRNSELQAKCTRQWGAGRRGAGKPLDPTYVVRGSVSTYRKWTCVATRRQVRQVEDYHFSVQMMAAWTKKNQVEKCFLEHFFLKGMLF